MDDVCCLALREMGQLGKALEQLASFDQLRHNIVVFLVFDQVDDADDIRMRLLSQDRELILQELDINFLFLNLPLGHYFHRKDLSRRPVRAVPDDTERSFSKLVSKRISVFDSVHELELFEVVYMQRTLLL